MALMEITVVPLGTSSPSVSRYVTQAVRVLKEEGIKYELTPMGTVIEGEIDKLLNIAKRMHLATFTQDVKRVLTSITIDDRRDKKSTITGKVASVKKKL
ncbi:MAG: MTH1187 family thiamine-binding protein [Candidatus Aerophobetes bacterium]|nr:MTH1187 family thiamine-binding protein [Candidatus Aerophobetes bacterium]